MSSYGLYLYLICIDNLNICVVQELSSVFQCNWTTGVIAPAWYMYWIAVWNRTGFITFPLDVGSSCWQLKSTSTPPLFFSHRNDYKHLVFIAIRFDLFFIIFLVDSWHSATDVNLCVSISIVLQQELKLDSLILLIYGWVITHTNFYKSFVFVYIIYIHFQSVHQIRCTAWLYTYNMCDLHSWYLGTRTEFTKRFCLPNRYMYSTYSVSLF